MAFAQLQTRCGGRYTIQIVSGIAASLTGIRFDSKTDSKTDG